MSEVRLIDANAITRDLIHRYLGASKYYSCTDDIVDLIDDQPTVDPVTHGHWENVSRILEVQTEGGFFQGQCSECRRFSYQPIGWGGDMDLEFCSSCGAKMDEKGE